MSLASRVKLLQSKCHKGHELSPPLLRSPLSAEQRTAIYAALRHVDYLLERIMDGETTDIPGIREMRRSRDPLRLVEWHEKYCCGSACTISSPTAFDRLWRR